MAHLPKFPDAVSDSRNFFVLIAILFDLQIMASLYLRFLVDTRRVNFLKVEASSPFCS